MKIVWIILPVFFLVQTCFVPNAARNSHPGQDTARRVYIIDFEKQVLPIFVKNCSPCHFAGGKMYERLPFDQDTTILNHQQAILKRIKNEEENTILKNFVLQNKNGLLQGKPH